MNNIIYPKENMSTKEFLDAIVMADNILLKFHKSVREEDLLNFIKEINWKNKIVNNLDDYGFLDRGIHPESMAAHHAKASINIARTMNDKDNYFLFKHGYIFRNGYKSKLGFIVKINNESL